MYHIYNRGINKQNIFFNDDNYLFFLTKIRQHLQPVCNILCYCLMPNHFHFLIEATNNSIIIKDNGAVKMQQLSYSLQHTLSSYTKAINKQRERTGSLFTQNTKCKNISSLDNQGNYAVQCFYYIHQNSWVAGLTGKIEDWSFSSFKDFVGLRNGTLINKERAFELLDLNTQHIYSDSYQILSKEKLALFNM
jgi:REP element-mobilizing transposase RayT